MLTLVVVGLLSPVSAAQDAAWPTSPKPAKQPEKKPGDKKPAEKKPADTKPAAPESERERLKREATGLFGPRDGQKPDQSRDDGSADTGPSGWTIVLAVFRGEERDSASRVLLQRVRAEGGLPEAFAARRNEAVVVGVGDFAGPEDPKALAELARVRELAFGGERPYQQAFLSPPIAGKLEGSEPRYNLVRAKELFGKDALYTLQVGVYGRLDLKNPTEQDLAEARKAAEAAAFKLRQEGELAFYYHSPLMSMVTVGVFDINDFDPQTPNYQSAKLRETRKRFPYNLYNGAGIKQKSKTAGESLQTSSLVALPNK